MILSRLSIDSFLLVWSEVCEDAKLRECFLNGDFISRGKRSASITVLKFKYYRRTHLLKLGRSQ